MKKIICCISVCLSAAFLSLSAQNCCSGGVPMANSLGLPIGESGSWQFSANYDLNLLRTLKDGTRTLNDDSRLRTTQSFLVSIGYNFNERFAVEGFMSYVRQERTITQTIAQQEVEDFTYTQGLGDAAILVKYRLTPAQSKSVWQIGAGVKFPTGAADKRRPDGIILSADLQPGSGSWDGIGWARFSTPLGFRPSMTVSATTTFNLRGKNPEYLQTQTFQVGNGVQILAGLADRFTLGKWLIDPSISFRIRSATLDRNNDQQLENTGGNWVFVVPGITLYANARLSWQTTLDMPIHSDLNGVQLTPTFRLNTGIYYQLSKPKKIGL